jgi:peptidoglycan/xylan/chitin deacetylase (PgdA/CDA1 family)
MATGTHTENVHPPIYEELVRERGDVVAEAQRAATHTEIQAAELLTGGEAPHWDQPTGYQGASS